MKKPKAKTVRFYSASDSYHGWKHLSEITYFEITSWLKAGNYLKFGNQIIGANATSSQIFNLLRKGK